MEIQAQTLTPATTDRGVLVNVVIPAMIATLVLVIATAYLVLA